MSDVDNIRKESSEKTEALSQKISALDTQARDLFSPVNQIEEYPFLACALALGAGLLVGSQLKNSGKYLEPLAVSLVGMVADEIGKKYLPPVA